MKIDVLPDNDDNNAWLHMLGEVTPAAALNKDGETDYAIIGAGYTGLAAARQLARHFPDASIALLDAGRIGNNAAGRCSGFAIDQAHNLKATSFADVIEEEKTQIKLNRAGQQVLREAVEEHAIDCDWREDGKIHGAGTERGIRLLKEFSDNLSLLGAPYTELDAARMKEITGTDFYLAGLDTPGTVQIQPAALVTGLAATMPDNVAVYENTPVTEVNYAASSSQAHTIVCHSGEARITLRTKVILLANNSFGTAFGFYDKHVMPFPTYASMSRELTDSEIATLGGLDSWGIIPADPFGTTVRRLHNNRILIRNIYAYAPDHNPTEKQRRWARQFHLKSFANRFPMLKDVELEYSWGGSLCLSDNGKPVFGQLSPGVFASLCHNGVGIARGAICGKLLADEVAGADSELLEIMRNAGRPNKVWPKWVLGVGAPLALAKRRWRAGGEL